MKRPINLVEQPQESRPKRANTLLKFGPKEALASLSSHWKDVDQLELGEDESIAALRKAWDRAIRTLSAKSSKSSFESFVAATQPLAIDDNVVVLGAPSSFAREWMEKRYMGTVRDLLRANMGRPDLEIRFVLASPSQRRPALTEGSPAPDAKESRPDGELEKPRAVKRRSAEPHRPAALPPDMSLPLNDKFTFDTFVTGKSNRLAYAGACAVADAPGTAYNPLFLYGMPGLGKTHLMHAIGHRIRETRPEARIAYTSGEAFTNSYVAALRERRFDEFRAIYRNVDVWLVDDIQTIAGKEHTKEEFFHTFNTLHQMNRQIVISSECSPRELRMMDERLRSRFECGLIADVAAPELEMRVAILQKKAEVESIPIPQDVLIYMANLIQSNIRTLEGALVKLMAHASFFHSSINKQLATDVLGSYFVNQRPLTIGQSRELVQTGDNAASELRALPIPPNIARLSQPSQFGGGQEFDHIVATVASFFGVDPASIAGDGSSVTARKRENALPRQIAIYLTRERTSITVIELASLFGGVGHSAVSHAHRKMTRLLEQDPRLLAQINQIVSRL